jgi:hypothetical protein
MKKYLFGLLAITMAVGFSAFTTKSAKKPFASVTYYYVPAQGNQRLEPGHTSGSLIERTITAAKFKDAVLGNSWQTSVVNFTSTSDMNAYIGSISFDEETTADGGNDGQVTLQEALDEVFAQYQAATPDLMPSSVQVATGSGSTPAVVTIVAKTAATP